MSRLQSIIGALAAGSREEALADHGPRPFITISRQAGAGGHTLQHRLVERLKKLDPAEPQWTGIDRELVEMVAGDDKAFARIIENLGDETRNWLDERFAEIFDFHKTEYVAYRRTAQAIRALADRGRVVIVGRGGVFVTRGMPMGVHVHLVAPLEDRIEHERRRLNISREEAAEHVQNVDRNREAFYKRYWPNDPLSAESFTVTFNTAGATDQEIADAVLTLVPSLDVTLSAKPTQRERRKGVFQISGVA